MDRIFWSIVFIMLSFQLQAAETFAFRLYLKDKGPVEFSTVHPEFFLSAEALDRRNRQQIPITESDLPIAQTYLDQLTGLGLQLVTRSKWQSTVVVAMSDSSMMEQVRQLPFVANDVWVWQGEFIPPSDSAYFNDRLKSFNRPLKSVYGYGDKQIRLLNADKLHKAGFRGEGIRIAVIDEGFKHVDRISVFDSIKIGGTFNAVFPGQSLFQADDHGTKVLACIAANQPNLLVGTAPEATYYLIKTEYGASEYPIEEDFWASGVEYADSAGVQLITSSLGYFQYDEPKLSYRQSDLNGKTAFITRSASLAAEKGLLLFISSGNEANGNWKHITFPADAEGVCVVGAIDEKKKRSNFSSYGFTKDNRMKPDVVALGTGTSVIDSEGQINFANGTSFATPALAGAAACLWQAFPGLTAHEMIELLKSVASLPSGNPEIGYGVPDFQKALKQAQKQGGK